DDREQRHRRNAQLDTALGIAEQEVDALARYPWQRRHLLFAIAAVENKYRINEIGAAKRGFAHQAARKFVATHAARAPRWKLSDEVHGLGIESGRIRIVARGQAPRQSRSAIAAFAAPKYDANRRGTFCKRPKSYLRTVIRL